MQEKAKIRILFNVWADMKNVNSQSLTAREIALRLRPERFVSRFFSSAGRAPDPRLVDRPGIELVKIPPRLGSVVILSHFLWGRHDILFYPSLNRRASEWSFRLGWLGRSTLRVESVECSWEQLAAIPPEDLAHLLRSVRRADLVTAITPAISRSLEEQGIGVDTMPLGVDLDLFHPMDREGRTAPWRVVFVGSIQQRKQPHLVLEMARRLRRLPVEFHLIGPTLGDPSYGEELVAEKERDGLTKVFFHGAMPQPEIVRWLERSDVYVLPSRLEGFGKTTLEAAGTGLPCVVFDDYETTAVVDGRTGFQVQTFEQMCERVEALLQDPALRRTMGKAASEHARSFDWSQIARRWEAHCERLVGSGMARLRD